MVNPISQSRDQKLNFLKLKIAATAILKIAFVAITHWPILAKFCVKMQNGIPTKATWQKLQIFKIQDGGRWGGLMPWWCVSLDSRHQDWLQAGSPCLQVSARYLADELCQPADTEARCLVCVPPRHRHWLSAVRGCQPSVTELFRSPALVSGTVYRSMSLQHRHWPFFAVASRLISSGAVFHDFTVLLSCPRSDMSLWTR